MFRPHSGIFRIPSLASRAAFADAQQYFTFRSFARNYPHRLNGHFTYNYFSSEYYKGTKAKSQTDTATAALSTSMQLVHSAAGS
jgi:hypothetical protein